MTAKEYLSQYRQLTVDINTGLDAALAIQAEMTKQTRLNDIEGLTAKERELHSILVEVRRLSDLRREIYLRIKFVKDDRQRRILELRYIVGYSWNEISALLYSDRRWVLRQHLQALENFDHLSPLEMSPNRMI